MRAAPAAALLALAACDRPPPSVPPAKAASQAEAPPAIAVPTGTFDAISNTAMGVTGNLVATPAGFAFARGQAYDLTGAGTVKGADPYASSGASFASLINVPDTADLLVFKVTREDPAKTANGGFCGAEPATFLAVHQGVDGSGAPALFILAFKGASAPGATTPETNLCGTFMYAPKTGSTPG